MHTDDFHNMPFDALCASAHQLHFSGHLAHAEQLYHHILTLNPHHADVLYKLSILYAQQQDYVKALQQIDNVISIQKDHPVAFYHRGCLLKDLKRFDEAVESYKAAISLQPDYAEALYTLGNTLFLLHRYEEALAQYDAAIHFQPDYAEAFNNRGAVFEYFQRFEEALADFSAAIAIKPKYAEAFYNRGMILQKLQRFEDAFEHYTTAISLKWNYAEAFNNRGTIFRQFMRFEESFRQYDIAISLKPDYADAHYNKSQCALLLGQFDIGWPEYEWRFKVEDMQERLGKAQHNAPSLLQQGHLDISGKTILLHTEQGMGDILQFCRYAQCIAECGATVILEVPLALKTLMQSLAGTHYVIARGETLPAYDLQCSIMSLPLIFATTLNSIPSVVPYLWADPSRMAFWNTKLGPKNGKLRIGLTWSGSTTHDNDHNRSIPLEQLLPLTTLPFQFYSLQKEIRETDQHLLNQSSIQDFSPNLETFADTAALMSQLDLIISVDTSIAHLAGALGKPVWILLPIIPDWRWLLKREDSPWYPTARLFRQFQEKDWSGVVQRIGEALLEYC